MMRGGRGGGGEGRRGARGEGEGGKGAEGGEGRRAARRLSSGNRNGRNSCELKYKPEGAGRGAKRGKQEGLLAACSFLGVIT